jgi:head-tail adaptor
MRPAGDIRIRAGDLRHVITIQVLVPASPPQYTAAGTAIGWQPYLTTRAAIQPMNSSDRLEGGLTITETGIVVTIYYPRGFTVTSQMRLVAPHGTYVIQGVENIDERDWMLELKCLALGTDQ